MSWYLNTILLVTIPLVFIYVWMRHRYGYWKRKGVFSPGATFPGGHMGKALFGKIHLGFQLKNYYDKTKRHPFIGLFMLNRKAILVNDMDLIKKILVKDFNYFPNHGFGFSVEHDPLSKHLPNMNDHEWKSLRTRLTPTFTSSKMKYMFDTMLLCAQDMMQYLDAEISNDKVVDLKDVLANYGTDVIGSCAFGIETNSFKYPDAEFRRIGKRISNLSTLEGFKQTLSTVAPEIFKILGLRVVPKDVEDFLVKSVDNTIKHRESNNIVRNDFMQLLIDMKNDVSGDMKPMTLFEMTAQVFFFFLAGFETSASAGGYAFYELAKNPDVQTKLRQEINNALEKSGGKITYEALSSIEYLTYVIDETLRLYPPLTFLFRVCEQDYLIPGTDVTIEKGTQVLISNFGIQRDPEIHYNPLKFDPERFAPENKQKRHPFSSIPFGEGPRSCIGNRFGMMQTRLGILSIVSNYDVSICKETTIPLQFDPKSFTLQSLGGQFLRLTKLVK